MCKIQITTHKTYSLKMLSTHRINKLLAEVNKLKQQQQTQQSKLNVLALLTRLYTGFRQKLYIENVIMADYVYIRDETEIYRPDEAVYILLETEMRYIQFCIKMTCKHSEINTRIWITADKNINNMAFDFEYIYDDTRFIEVYNNKDEKTKYGLTKFDKYMIKLIVDEGLQNWCLEPQLTSDTITVIGTSNSCEEQISDEEDDQLQDIQLLGLNNIGSLWE